MPVKLLQLYPTLLDSMEYNPPGSSVHGIFQARILEWVAMPSSRGSSQPKDLTCISYVSCIGRRVLYHSRHLGSQLPKWCVTYIVIKNALGISWMIKVSVSSDKLCQWYALLAPYGEKTTLLL